MARYVDHLSDIDIESGEDYMVDCPFCEELGKRAKQQYKLGVSTSKEIYHCFKCGATGSIYTLLKEVLPESVLFKHRFQFDKTKQEDGAPVLDNVIDYNSITRKLDKYSFNAWSYLNVNF